MSHAEASVWGGNERGLSVPLERRFDYVLKQSNNWLVVDQVFDGEPPREPLWQFVFVIQNEQGFHYFPLIGYREIDSEVIDGKSVVVFRRIDDARYS